MSDHKHSTNEHHDQKSIGKNSPVFFQLHPKPSVFLKSPPSVGRINYPSNYVLSTHNHSALFAQKAQYLSSVLTQESELGSLSKYDEHLSRTYEALTLIKTFKEPSVVEIAAKRVNLPRRGGYEHKRTVVFDLDETLVHCIEDPNQADVPLCINLPGCFPLMAGINIRPYAKEILESTSKDFEVIVFTASHQAYADKVINFLDPHKQFVHHRLYRDNCLVINGVYVKDLRVLGGRNINDILIVDNATYSFAFQVDNGIPIMSWYHDKSDKELFKLIGYLKMLAQDPEMVRTNAQVFRLWEFYKEFSGNEKNMLHK